MKFHVQIGIEEQQKRDEDKQLKAMQEKARMDHEKELLNLESRSQVI